MLAGRIWRPKALRIWTWRRATGGSAPGAGGSGPGPAAAPSGGPTASGRSSRRSEGFTPGLRCAPVAGRSGRACPSRGPPIGLVEHVHDLLAALGLAQEADEAFILQVAR